MGLLITAVAPDGTKQASASSYCSSTGLFFPTMTLRALRAGLSWSVGAARGGYLGCDSAQCGCLPPPFDIMTFNDAPDSEKH